MNAFTIKDLENLSGIKAHTIRIWEQRYAFLKPQRTDTNIRYYNNDELKTLLNVALLNKFGFKISHIDKMRDFDLKEKILTLTQSQAQQERAVNELIGLMVDMDADRFEDLLNEFITDRGIEKTITQIIFPFLEKIGILWITNHIQPAQEHLVANIIRQKLIVGIDKASSHFQFDKTVVLFLPEGEHHELGILFVYYLLKNRGVRVWYLGANVPVKDLEYVVKAKKPDFIFSHLTSVASNFSFEKFLDKLHHSSGGTPSVISGQLTLTYKKKVPATITLRRSLQEMTESIYAL